MEDNELPFEVEADLELSQPKPMPSYKGLRRTTYMRRVLLRMMKMSPAELAAYEPRTSLEALAKVVILNALKADTKNDLAVKTWREIKETLGERIGSRWKDTQEHNQPGWTIVNDLGQSRREDN